MSDKLDSHIEVNLGMGNRHYAEALTIIRDRLRALENTASSAFAGNAWLIEVGSPAIYYCAEGDWCSNANHAHKFATKAEAELVALTMRAGEPVRCVEHTWMSTP